MDTNNRPDSNTPPTEWTLLHDLGPRTEWLPIDSDTFHLGRGRALQIDATGELVAVLVANDYGRVKVQRAILGTGRSSAPAGSTISMAKVAAS